LIFLFHESRFVSLIRRTLAFVTPTFWASSKISPIASLIGRPSAVGYPLSIQQFQAIYRLVRRLPLPLLTAQDQACDNDERKGPIRVQKPLAAR
jgi:hypothetical protein